jgi:hypothetical protein
MTKLTEPYKKQKEEDCKKSWLDFLNCDSIEFYCSFKAIYYYKLPKNPCLAEIKDYVIVIIKYV